ncbi:MAG: hypothetical protein EPO01_19440, partial [Aquabacterium sp.]
MNHCTNDIPSPHRGWAPRVMALVAASLVVLGLSARDAAAQQRTGGRDITTASDESEVRKRARIRMELASAYYTQGQMTTALDEVKQALVADPGLPGAHNLRGLIYDALGNDGLAEESFS